MAPHAAAAPAAPASYPIPQLKTYFGRSFWPAPLFKVRRFISGVGGRSGRTLTENDGPRVACSGSGACSCPTASCCPFCALDLVPVHVHRNGARLHEHRARHGDGERWAAQRVSPRRDHGGIVDPSRSRTFQFRF